MVPPSSVPGGGGMMTLPPRTFLIGAGVSKFTRPGKLPYQQSASDAVGMLFQEDLLPGVDKHSFLKEYIDAAVCSYNYGAPTCGQAALRAAFAPTNTGIPVFNSNNNCCAGSTAIVLGRSLLRGRPGGYECVLVLGFEEMGRGLSVPFPEMRSPVGEQFAKLAQLCGEDASDGEATAAKYTSDTVKLFAKVAGERAYSPQFLAEVAAKNRCQGRTTKYGMLYRSPLNKTASTANKAAIAMAEPPGNGATTKNDFVKMTEKALRAPELCESTTIAMAGPTGNGAAAVLVCSECFLEKHPELRERAVEILADALVSDVGGQNSTSLPFLLVPI